MTINVVVAGYFGFGNLGDEAILETLLTQLKSADPRLQPVVLSGSPADTSGKFNVEVVHWQDWDAISRHILNAKALVIGGGGLFHDYWQPRLDEVLTDRQHGLSYYASLTTWAKLFQLPILAYGVGIGPLATSEGRELATWILDGCSWIGVRDNYSLSQLNQLELKVDKDLICIGADLALQHPKFDRDPHTHRPDNRSSTSGPILGVNLRYWDFGIEPERLTKDLALALEMWLKKSDGRITFIPFQREPESLYEDDLAVIKLVIGQMASSRRCRVVEPAGLEVIVHELAGMDMLLASRYHAALLGLSRGVPTAILSYDPKCDALASELEIEDLALPLKEISPDAVMKRLSRLSGIIEASKPTLTSRLEEMRARGSQVSVSFMNNLLEMTKEPKEEFPGKSLLRERLNQGQVAFSWLDRELDHIDPLEEPVEFDGWKLKDYLQRKSDELRQAQLDLSSLAEAHREVQSELDRLSSQAQTLEFELRAIRQTLGFRLLASFWALARRLFPAGSSRRRLFMAFSQLTRRLWNKVSRQRLIEAGPEFDAQAQSKWLADHRAAFETFAGVQFTKEQTAIVLIAPTRFDPNEGQRSVHLALELADRGIPVLFAYWRWSADFQPAEHRPHPRIFHTPIDLLLEHPDFLLNRFPQQNKWLLCEFPYPDLFPMIAGAHSQGWRIIYDVIDHWEAFSRSGQAPWYEKPFEDHLIHTADLVMAASPSLKESVKSDGKPSAHLLPNAASTRVRPISGNQMDQTGEVVIGYFGNLSPAWFDWGFTVELAKRQPDWRFEIIGERPEGIPKNLPENLHLLGKEPQDALGKASASWDVAIAPFKPGPLAEATDAIKIYEYLALGLPVVARGINAPPGASEFVVRADCLDEFIAAVERDSGGPSDVKRRLAFAADNTWSTRADYFLQLIEADHPRIKAKEFLFSP